ncbi:MAG: MFS transporter [Candidatus Rokubacteria bacterium]|nr:MFS transporter [Candidatus Rokubacteria bacterium]MBI2553480.1 MFS transporter [Candidatus Rokubacteria bacterium]
MATALLCLMIFCNTFSIGAFGPLLPEIARAQGLADWQLGVVAGAFGFARVLLDIPAGRLAGRRLAAALVAAPLFLLAGTLLLASAGPLAILALGRFLIGVGHALGMVGGLTALLERGEGAAFRLNTFEFSGMLGILGGITLAGLLPGTWSWNRSFLLVCSPQLIVLALLPAFGRLFSRRAGHARSQASGPVMADGGKWPPIVTAMFVVGAVIAFAWSSVSQFLIPLRGTREFGLDRAGNSRMLAIPQVVDLVALLPVGYLADRLGRRALLGVVCVALGAGTFFVGLGPFPLFVLGSALFGLGLAGWMLPIGVIREHTPLAALGWRTGLYRVGVDAGIFLGPLVSGLLGEAGAGYFVGLIGLVALGVGARLVATSAGSAPRGPRRA